MVAEIGGYVGLLMGISLCKLGDVLNYTVDFYLIRKNGPKDNTPARISVISCSDSRGSELKSAKDSNGSSVPE